MSQLLNRKNRYFPYWTPGFSSVPVRPPPTWNSRGQPAEFLTTPRRGSTASQHSSLTSFARVPSARPQNTQAWSYPQLPVQSGVGQAPMYQGTTRGGSSGAQMPFNVMNVAHPPAVNAMPANPPPHTREPCSFPTVYDMSMAHEPDIPRQSLADFHVVPSLHQGITGWGPPSTQSLSSWAFQSSVQTVTPPQQAPLEQDLSKVSATTAQPSQAASVSSGYASSTESTSVREETESKEAPLATVPCPFPRCEAKYRRPQELERHIREHHLPQYIYCEQLGCDWAGYRLYELRAHFVDKHSGVPMPKQEVYTIYNAKGIAKQIVNNETTVEQAVVEAWSLFEEKAKEMGKLGIWRG